MVLHIIRADILLIARIFPRPENTTQLAKYPRVLYAKPSIKIYVLFTALGRKCYICSSQVSPEDCAKSQKELTCPAGTSCGTFGIDFQFQGVKTKSYAKACYPEAQCKDAEATVLKACKDAEKAGAKADCKLTCCDKDLCNGGSAPMVSVILMVTCALVSFLR